MAAPAFLVLANARAGGTEQEGIEEAMAALRPRADVELAETTWPDELDPLLDRLDGRPLIVAGGDGSLHVVVERLWRRGRLSETVLGLLPLGTGNDLARGLGLPLSPAEAAAVVLDGSARSLDLLVSDHGEVVVNAVHAGLGAEAAERSSGFKERLGPLAYPVGALLAAVRRRGWRLEVTLDGRVLRPGLDSASRGRLLMVGVANGPLIGAGTPLCPPARPDDGLLDVVVVAATGPAARAAFAAALRKGEHLQRDDVDHAQGREVVVAGEPVRHDADGEVSEEVTRRTYRVLPGVWRLLAPAAGALPP